MPDKKKCSLCGDKFWNSCHPREKGVFLVLALAFMTVFLTLGFIILPIYQEVLSKNHQIGYLLMFISNLFLIVAALLMLHFLTLSAKELTFCRCVVIYFLLIVASIFSILSLWLWLTTPSKTEMREYVKYFLFRNTRVPRILDRMQTEAKCCGIENFIDYSIPQNENVFKRLPDSCCITRYDECGNFRGIDLNGRKNIEQIILSERFYLNGCFSTKDFKDFNLIAPKAYARYQARFYCYFLSPLLILALGVVFSYYVCYKLVRKNNEEVPEWGQEDFQPFSCFSDKKMRGPLPHRKTLEDAETPYPSTSNVHPDSGGHLPLDSSHEIASSSSSITKPPKEESSITLGVDNSGIIHVTPHHHHEENLKSNVSGQKSLTNAISRLGIQSNSTTHLPTINKPNSQK